MGLFFNSIFLYPKINFIRVTATHSFTDCQFYVVFWYKKNIWEERWTLGLLQVRHPSALSRPPVFLLRRWTGLPSITDDREEIWSSSPLDQSPGWMKYDIRWAVSLSRTQHEYRSSLCASDSSASLWQAPMGEACLWNTALHYRWLVSSLKALSGCYGLGYVLKKKGPSWLKGTVFIKLEYRSNNWSRISNVSLCIRSVSAFQWITAFSNNRLESGKSDLLLFDGS